MSLFDRLLGFALFRGLCAAAYRVRHPFAKGGYVDGPCLKCEAVKCECKFKASLNTKDWV